MEPEPIANLALDAPRQEFGESLNNIARATRGFLAVDDFYDFILSRAVDSLQAVGGAIWVLNAEGQITLVRSVQIDVSHLFQNADDEIKHQQMLERLLAGDSPQVIAPHDYNQEGDAENPTNYCVILGPLMIDQRVDGVVEIFQQPETPEQLHSQHLRFVMQVCGLTSDYLRTLKIRDFAERQAVWEHVETFVREVHGSLDCSTTCYAVANEGRRLLDCDRLSVALKRGRSYVIQAVSGQDTINPRSEAITLLNRLASSVGATGDEVWYSGDTAELSPQIEELLQTYVDSSHSATVAIVPLRRISTDESEATPKPPDEIFGVLIAETFKERDFSHAFRQRVVVAVRHGSAALANSVEHRDLFLMPLWRSLGRLKLVTKARRFPWYATVGGLVLSGLIALCFIQTEFELSGRGTLEPVVKRNVFAGLNGTVTEVKIDHGHVRAGDELLVIDSTETKTELMRLRGERDSKLQEQLAKDRLVKDSKQSESERNRAWSEIEGLKAQLVSLTKQIDLVAEEKFAHASVTSPIDGDIISWQAREKLDHRPIEKGQVLMTIADLDQPWHLEVWLPEDRIGHVNEALHVLSPGEKMNVNFILASDPGRPLHGTVKEIHRAAETHGDEGNVVLIRVAIDKDAIKDRRPGAGVIAKFSCGRRSVAYVWFHDVLAFVQSKVLF